MAKKELHDALVDGLNEDLNLELEAVLRYLYHASTATGLLGHELRELLKADIPGELNHAIFLADKIAALGGELKIAVEMPKKVKTAKQMMEIDIQAERRSIANYGQRIKQAEEFGDRGLVIRLENILSEETDHAEELERLNR
jgi:bacterioferritin